MSAQICAAIRDPSRVSESLARHNLNNASVLAITALGCDSVSGNNSTDLVANAAGRFLYLAPVLGGAVGGAVGLISLYALWACFWRRPQNSVPSVATKAGTDTREASELSALTLTSRAGPGSNSAATINASVMSVTVLPLHSNSPLQPAIRPAIGVSSPQATSSRSANRSSVEPSIRSPTSEILEMSSVSRAKTERFDGIRSFLQPSDQAFPHGTPATVGPSGACGLSQSIQLLNVVPLAANEDIHNHILAEGSIPRRSVGANAVGSDSSIRPAEVREQLSPRLWRG